MIGNLCPLRMLQAINNAIKSKERWSLHEAPHEPALAYDKKPMIVLAPVHPVSSAVPLMVCKHCGSVYAEGVKEQS